MALASAQNLGGVVVTVGADMAGLRAALPAAKAIATQIEKVKAVVKAVLDVSEIKTGLMRIQAMARSLPPIRIPVQFVPAGGASGIRGMGGMGGGLSISGPGSGGGGMLPPSMLNIPSIGPGSGQRLLSGPSAGPMNYGNQGPIYPRYMSTSAQSPQTAAMAENYASQQRAYAMRSRMGISGMGGLIGAAAVTQSIYGGSQDTLRGRQISAAVASGQTESLTGYDLSLAAGGYNSANKSGNILYAAKGFDPGFGTGGEANIAHAIAPYVANIPIAGQIYKGVANMFASGPLGDAAAINAETDRAATGMQVRTAEIKSVKQSDIDVRGSYAASAARNASPEAALNLAAGEQRAQFDDRMRGTSQNVRQQIEANERKAMEADIASQRVLLGKQRYEQYQGNYTAQVQSVYAIAAAGTGTGSGDRAFAAQQASAKFTLGQTHAAELRAETDPTARASISARQSGQSSALEAQQSQERIERAQGTQERLRTIAVSGHTAILQAQQQGYQAELAAFDEAAQQRVDAAKNKSAEEQRVVTEANKQMRSAVVSTQSRSIAGAQASFDSAANVATLQSEGRNNEAQVAAFDAETEARKQTIDDKLLDGFVRSRATQRQALLNSQSRQDVMDDTALAGRRASAQYRGQGLSQAAGVATLAAQQANELEANDPSKRKGIAATQREELNALKAEALRPRSYASEFDPHREVVGGPDGNTGKDQVKLLELIAERLKALDKITAPTVLSN